MVRTLSNAPNAPGTQLLTPLLLSEIVLCPHRCSEPVLLPLLGSKNDRDSGCYIGGIGSAIPSTHHPHPPPHHHHPTTHPPGGGVCWSGRGLSLRAGHCSKAEFYQSGFQLNSGTIMKNTAVSTKKNHRNLEKNQYNKI